MNAGVTWTPGDTPVMSAGDNGPEEVLPWRLAGREPAPLATVGHAQDADDPAHWPMAPDFQAAAGRSTAGPRLRQSVKGHVVRLGQAVRDADH